MPLLTQFLIDEYGWRGAMMLLGAIKFNSIASGATLRPISTSDAEQYSKPNAQVTNVEKDLQVRENLRESSTRKTNLIQRFRRVLTHLSYYLDLSLFVDGDFISMVLYSIGNGYCMAGWLIYLVPYGLEIGLESYMASSLATFGGLGQLVGNLLFPILIRLFTSRQILYFSTLVLFAAVMTNPLASAFYSYIGLIFSSIAFGAGRGIAILAFYQDCKQTLDPSQVTNAVMWFHVSYSIGAIGSGFLSGTFDIGQFHLNSTHPLWKI